MKKLTITKAKYPQKTSINLAMKEQEGKGPKFQIGVFLLFLVLLAVFVKFAVVDRVQEAGRAESEYTSIQSQIGQLKEQTVDYAKVQEEYSQYSEDFLSASEQLEMDRMDVISLLETSVLTKADVRSVEITGNTVTVTIDHTTLDTVSAVVAALQSDARTSFVTVSTAGTGMEEEENQLVTADIVITLAGGALVDES